MTTKIENLHIGTRRKITDSKNAILFDLGEKQRSYRGKTVSKQYIASPDAWPSSTLIVNTMLLLVLALSSRVTHGKTPLPYMGYHAKFGRSMSNSINREPRPPPPPKNGGCPAFQCHSRSANLAGLDRVP